MKMFSCNFYLSLLDHPVVLVFPEYWWILLFLVEHYQTLLNQRRSYTFGNPLSWHSGHADLYLWAKRGTFGVERLAQQTKNISEWSLVVFYLKVRRTWAPGLLAILQVLSLVGKWILGIAGNLLLPDCRALISTSSKAQENKKAYRGQLWSQWAQLCGLTRA